MNQNKQQKNSLFLLLGENKNSYVFLYFMSCCFAGRVGREKALRLNIKTRRDYRESTVDLDDPQHNMARNEVSSVLTV